jgi:hypothetical protein
MMEWFRERSLLTRILVYAAATTSLFVLAAGVGAMITLLSQGAQISPGTAKSRSLDKQESAAQSQEKDIAGQKKAAPQPEQEEENAVRSQEKDTAEQEEAAPQPERDEEAARQQSEVEYLGQVGDLQSNCVERFLDSHDKLLHYDMLTTDDVAEMQVNESALRGCANQVDDLNPPQRYGGQHKVYRSAIHELHEAAQLAYSLVANPTAATKTEFDEYDRRVSEAAGRLRQSNEILGRDYRTIGDVQQISPL